MTTLHHECSQRKSSVYNQTGQNYFEQLSAYNRMSSHLRRILMAQCVVDSRNKKYMRDKRLASRQSDYTKSLDQILARKEFIDDVAYDTEHHPADLLRMRLDCNSNCGGRTKRQIYEQTYKCSNIRCSSASPKTVHRVDANLEPRRSRINTAHYVASNSLSMGYSRPPPPPVYRRNQQPEVDALRHKNGGETRIPPHSRNRKVFEAINETYSYDSSFESISDASDIESPIGKKFDDFQARGITDAEQVTVEVGRKYKKVSDHVDSTEEAKYSKFLYDITQEILVHGLYTDRELEQIFKKHIEMNLENLDKERMLSEIHQLKSSLNVREYSEDEEGMENYGYLKKFVTSTPLKNQKKRNQERTSSDPTEQRPKIANSKKNLFLLVESSPDMLINQRDMLVTLMEMKLDPKQVQTICRSLQEKSRGTIEHKSGSSNFQDDMTQATVPEIEKSDKSCMCQCREEAMRADPIMRETKSTKTPVTKELQTDEEMKETGIQTPVMRDSRGITTTKSLERISEVHEKSSRVHIPEVEKISTSDETKSQKSTTSKRDETQLENATRPASKEKDSIVQPEKKYSQQSLRSPKEIEEAERISEERRKKSDDSEKAEQPESKKSSIAFKTSEDSEGSKKSSVASEKLERPRSKKSSNISKLSEDPEKVSQASKKTSGCSEKSERPRSKKSSLASKVSEDPEKVSQASKKKSTASEKSERPESKKSSIDTKVSEDPEKVSQASKKKSAASEKSDHPESKKSSTDTKVSEDPEKVFQASKKKSSTSQKSERPESKKSSIDTKVSERSVGKKSSTEPVESSRTSSKDSKATDTEISAASDGTMTEIITEDKSVATKDHGKHHEITDDELASLPEDFSEAEDSQVDESSSLILEEKLEDKHRKTFETQPLQVVNESDEDISSKIGSDANGRKRSKKSDKHDSEETEGKMGSHLEHDPEAESKKHSESTSASKRPTRQKKSVIESTPDPHDAFVASRRPTESPRLASKKQSVRAVSHENLSERKSHTRSVVSLHSSEKSDDESDNEQISPRVCNPCWGNLKGRALRRNESTSSLDAPTVCIKRSNYPARSMTTASDLSLLNKEDIVEVSNREHLSVNNETRDSQVVPERESKSLPWMHVERESTLKHFDTIPSRQETVQRKTSLMQSVKMAVASLKRRKTTSPAGKRDTHGSPVEPPATPVISTPEHRDASQERPVEGLKSREPSEHSPRGSDTTRTKESPRVTIQEERPPRIPSSNASTSTRGDFEPSDDERPPPVMMNRCRPDCRGYLSKLNHSGAYSTSSTLRVRGLSVSARSIDSVEDEDY